MIFWRWWGKKGQYIAPIQCFTNFYTERLHSSTKQWRMTRTTNNIHEEWQKPHIASSMCRWHMCVKQRLASNVRRMYACMCVFRFIWNLCYWNGEISFLYIIHCCRCEICVLIRQGSHSRNAIAIEINIMKWNALVKTFKRSFQLFCWKRIQMFILSLLFLLHNLI